MKFHKLIRTLIEDVELLMLNAASVKDGDYHDYSGKPQWLKRFAKVWWQLKFTFLGSLNYVSSSFEKLIISFGFTLTAGFYIFNTSPLESIPLIEYVLIIVCFTVALILTFFSTPSTSLSYVREDMLNDMQAVLKKRIGDKVSLIDELEPYVEIYSERSSLQSVALRKSLAVFWAIYTYFLFRKMLLVDSFFSMSKSAIWDEFEVYIFCFIFLLPYSCFVWGYSKAKLEVFDTLQISFLNYKKAMS